jgi:hypothetical protein
MAAPRPLRVVADREHLQHERAHLRRVLREGLGHALFGQKVGHSSGERSTEGSPGGPTEESGKRG